MWGIFFSSFEVSRLSIATPLWSTLVLDTLDHLTPSGSVICLPYELSERKLGDLLYLDNLFPRRSYGFLPIYYFLDYKFHYIADWSPCDMAEKLTFTTDIRRYLCVPISVLMVTLVLLCVLGIGNVLRQHHIPKESVRCFFRALIIQVSHP